MFHSLGSFFSDRLVSSRLGSGIAEQTVNFSKKFHPSPVTGDRSDHTSNVLEIFHSRWILSADIFLVE